MTFAWDPKRFASLDEYRAFLKTTPVPSWLKGITIHHSASPDQSTWAGMTHMKNLGFYYQYQVQNPDGSRGWPAGPHLFLAAKTRFDGIYQGTPIATRGVHAGPCNYSRLGIEVVGNFDLKPWDPEVATLVYGVVLALMDWAKIPIKEVWVHRECMPGHTNCPGRNVQGDQIRAKLFQMREQIPTPVPVYTRILGVPPSCSLESFWRSLDRNMPLDANGNYTLDQEDAKYIYDSCKEFDVDPAALLAIWGYEQGTNPYGKSPLGQISRNPHNMRAAAGEWRWTVKKPGTNDLFFAFESWKIGLMYAMLHLKNYYGGYRRLYTLEEIVQVFAPASDGNDPETYIQSVKAIMTFIREN